MSTLARWTAALGGVVAIAATAAPANASFLQELGSPFPVGSQPYGVVTADFNRDGLPDVMALNGSTNFGTTILRRPAGGFQIEGTTTVAAGPAYGVVGDFNRDNVPDVAVAGYNAPGAVTVHLRVAGGFMSANGSPYSVAKAGAIAAADFNADGLLDLVASRYDADGLTVLLQQVNGSFVAEGNAPSTGLRPRYIAVGDFNGDTRPDVAVSNVVGDSLTVLLRRPVGQAGFDAAPGSPIAVGDGPVALVARDFTGDTRLDLAVVNSNNDNVSVLVGQGNGAFSPLPGSPFAVGDGPYGLAAADFNGDGLLDLATANNTSDNVSVLLRTTTGFNPEVGSPYPGADGPNQLATADFNVDGKPDLAITNDQSNNLTVLLNTTPAPTPPPTPPGPGPVPGPGPTPTPTAPSVNARLILTWTITKASVRLNSATLRDLPAGGSTVKVSCKACKVSQTIKAKKTTLSLPKLVDKRLKRGATFTVTISKPGWNGLTFTRKVKQYGRTKKALRKAVKAPFSETRKCVPLAAGAKC
ncbi:VCBS repeat-containing protein [Solirubrobacter phytolaccae]|uniref:VCBS repeat-containing protein n=1 Tax=Solirubrobacter phytolaccae TaxID=1404360 RepID=A0A9X3N9X6_9ACTN|nr:VCBS repeat-containing protein [Solirubrobacter phytolaccae]MDA0180221.1 VCBS repeat-containing protein [Solirubrobacter phytolaccae]